MSHEITATDATLSVREMPWMGLLDGQVNVLDEYPTREAAQRLTMDWEPVEAPVYRAVPYVDDEGPKIRYEVIEGSKAIERSDNGAHLGVVNETFVPVSNNDLWDVAEAIGSIGQDIKIETAGSLRGGKDVWALLRLDEPLEIKGDPNGASVAFFGLQNGHTGNTAFRGQGLNTRIVCANTSAAADLEAKRNGYEFTFKHSKNVGERVEEAKAAVTLWREGIANWKMAMEHLLSLEITPEQQRWFVEQFHPMPPERLISDRVRNNVEVARGELQSILSGPTSEGIDLTAYGLAQAGIEWRQHYQATKGTDERTRMENRFRRNMLSGDRFRADVIDLAKQAVSA